MKLLLQTFTVFLFIHASWAAAIQEKDELSARITDSGDAYPGQFPYQAAIEWGQPPFIKFKTVCGGSIIDKNWILTSAQCVLQLSKFGEVKIKVGKHQTQEESEYVQTIGIAVRLVHNEFDWWTKENDIALLKLDKPLQLNERVKPITLGNIKCNNSKAIVTGWGSTSKGIWIQPPKVLQKAEVSIIENNVCNDALRAISIRIEVAKKQLCTGPLDETVSACTGDAGGPLIQIDGSKKPVQIGIVSWNTYPCGKIGAPTVYTRVSSFIDWIEDRLNEV